MVPLRVASCFHPAAIEARLDSTRLHLPATASLQLPATAMFCPGCGLRLMVNVKRHPRGCCNPIDPMMRMAWQANVVHRPPFQEVPASVPILGLAKHELRFTNSRFASPR